MRRWRRRVDWGEIVWAAVGVAYLALVALAMKVL